VFAHGDQVVLEVGTKGRRLVIPEDCPAVVAQLMRDCWKEAPQRPTFDELILRLEV
jgi:hypothetical protein